jgi:hypothetical protein
MVTDHRRVVLLRFLFMISIHSESLHFKLYDGHYHNEQMQEIESMERKIPRTVTNSCDF